MLKRTPLFEAHQRAGGRLIEFGGWEMPVQYLSIMDEHQAVRNACGIFDISHMGELFVEGPGAGDFLNRLLTNDVSKLTNGKAQYSLMCNSTGGVIDDLYVYCTRPDSFLLIVNASRIEADFKWLESAQKSFGSSVQVRNESENWGAVAVQGPKASAFVPGLFPPGVGGLNKNEFLRTTFEGTSVYVARTGYTGEDGFEVVAPSTKIEAVWDACLAAGTSHGLKPAGLGARDTLRTEMCYPLYGHELNETTTPIEAGVGFFVAFDKGEFNGRETLAIQKQNGAQKKCVAFVMTTKSAPPRPDYPICAPGGEKIGVVTSGTQSPSLGNGIGLGYVPSALAKAGSEIEIEIRGRRAPAKVVTKPIYKKH
jgi:aminomethyltransferase